MKHATSSKRVSVLVHTEMIGLGRAGASGKNKNETGSARVVPRVYRNRDGEVDATGGPRRIEGRLGRAS